MKLYGAIDLHSNNNVTVLIDEQDKVVYEKRLPNDLGLIAQQLAAYQSSLEGIVVESTYNWYWLVDGLMDKGHQIHLANTAAIQQYEGLKHTDDKSDARWLAHILRLGVLPEGYIYPKEERAVRDLLRKRGQMVRQRTANLLSIQNLITRNTGSAMNSNRIKTLEPQQVDELLADGDLALAVKANVAMMQCANGQIEILERTVRDRIKLRPEFCFLKTVPGIGQTLALTIMLETGDIGRFAGVGNYASYCRCVGSQKLSNGHPSLQRSLSGKGLGDIERNSILHDVITSPAQLVGHRFDRYHAMALGFLSLIKTVDPGTEPNGEVGRFDKRPG
jgi:transposase